MTFQVRRVSSDRPRRPFPWQKVTAIVLMFRKPFQWWFSHWQKHHEEEERKERRTNLLKRIALILVVVLCAVVLIAGSVSALVQLKLLNIRDIVSVAAVELPKDAYGHTNVLLLGTGDEGHQGVDLTDTMMIASIDPHNTESVAMLSIPRDLYLLNTQNMGRGRINAVYRDYKAQLKRQQGVDDAQASSLALQELSDELGRLLGIQIHRVIKVDFIGFVQAVDAIGGIDIDVPEDLYDAEYPGPNYTYTTFFLTRGPQHLDGETALKYARSRHSTSDFSRSARQQQIISALAEKMKSEGLLTRPDRILSLLDIMKQHVEMTLSSRELLALAELGMDIDRSKTLNLQLNDQAGLYGGFAEAGGFLYAPPRDEFGGASVLLPVSIPPSPVTWKQIRALISLYLNDRSPYFWTVPVDILNAGAPSGSSRRLGSEFIRYGLNVGNIENAETRDMDASVIRASEDAKEQAEYLSNFLKMPLEILTTEPGVTQSGSVSVLLGKDYVYTPFQNLLLPTE